MSRKIEYTVLSLIEDGIRSVKANPMNLGGISGPGGGQGGPPGGFIGMLPQYQVAYDSTEAATLATVGSGTLVDNLNHIRYRLNIVESGWTLTVMNYDGNPSVNPVDTIIFSGATITNLGGGNVLVAVSGGAGAALTVEEVDGSPSVSSVDKIKFLGATVEDQGSGDVLVTIPPLNAYKLDVTVASNNITVALKNSDGNNPSTTAPVYVKIGNTVRTITSALSVTKNAGTNWFNSGGSELATKEVDYFVYLIWNTTPGTDVVDIGFARIAHGRLYSNFSGTTTNEKYLAFGNASTPTSTDEVALIGRFAATLSATASFNWSVPTFTNANLIHETIRESRWLTFAPVITGYSANPTTVRYQYKVRYDTCEIDFSEAVAGTSNSTQKIYTMPFVCNITSADYMLLPMPVAVDNGSITPAGYGQMQGTTRDMAFFRSAGTAWTAAGSCRVVAVIAAYQI